MAGARQPIELVLAKGNKHLTKSEIEERKKSEVKAPADNIKPPSYLEQSQKREFRKIAAELISIDIMSNLDCDALAQYIIAKDNYLKYNKLVSEIPATLVFIDEVDKATKIQDRAYKQMQSAAKELGLTISSRCKLVVPKKEEPKENKFSKFQKGVG